MLAQLIANSKHDRVPVRRVVLALTPLSLFSAGILATRA